MLGSSSFGLGFGALAGPSGPWFSGFQGSGAVESEVLGFGGLGLGVFLGV